jgi:hypothetical protein
MMSVMSCEGGHLGFFIGMRNILTFLICLPKNALVIKTNKTFLLNIGIYYMYSFMQYYKVKLLLFVMLTDPLSFSSAMFVLCHCTGCRKRLAGKFINSAGISPTAKNKSDNVQYENLPCNMTINHKKRILSFYNTA